MPNQAWFNSLESTYKVILCNNNSTGSEWCLYVFIVHLLVSTMHELSYLILYYAHIKKCVYS